MRNIVDKKDSLQIVKLTSPNGHVDGYNVENTDAVPGTVGFVAAHCGSLREAREYAGIVLNCVSKETKPKSAYPEQQSGYSRPTRRR